MKTQEKAYIAGIIDGEGTVTLSRSHLNEMPSPKVSVANNNLELLSWIKKTVGNGVIVKRSKRLPTHGSQYVLDISNDFALKLLLGIKEFLIIKRPHAELLLEKYKEATPRNGRYTESQLAKKLKLVEDIRALNRISRRGCPG